MFIFWWGTLSAFLTLQVTELLFALNAVKQAVHFLRGEKGFRKTTPKSVQYISLDAVYDCITVHNYFHLLMLNWVIKLTEMYTMAGIIDSQSSNKNGRMKI